MQDYRKIGHYLLTKNFENFYSMFESLNGFYPTLVTSNLNNMSSPGSLLLSILNNFDAIIQTLENSKSIVKEPYFNVAEYVEKDLYNLDKNLSFIFSQELTHYIFLNNSKLKRLENALKINTDTLKKFREINESKENIELLETEEQQLLEKIEIAKNKSGLLIKYIDDLISLLQQHKSYLDIYYSIDTSNDLTKKEIAFFTGAFNLNFIIPKHELYQAFIEDNKIVLTDDLLLSCFNKLTKKQENFTDEELEQNVFDTIHKLYDNKEIFSLKYYEIFSIKDLLSIFFNFFMENNITINKCKNCGKYFIPSNRTDEKYCDNPSPQNPSQTCKKYGAKRVYSNIVKSNAVKSEHIRTSQFYRVRISRAKEKNDISFANKMQKLLDSYLENYQKQLNKFNNNKISEEDFIVWIKSQKKDK